MNNKMDNRKKKFFDKKTFLRLISYLKPYRVKMCIVLICIIFTALNAAYMTLYLQVVIDDYITPMLTQSNPSFTPLLHSMIKYGCILSIAVVTTLIYNLFMVNISQSIIRDIRDDMFNKMQHYPIGYFDKNKFGDLMSFYTNDVDTIREFFARALCQIFNAAISIIFVFSSMLLLSFNLTIFVLIGAFLIKKYSSFITSKSGHHFIETQKSVASLNAFVEEMINGSKEVKSFCYENINKSNFQVTNEKWRGHSTKANLFAQTMMPSIFGLGNCLYIFIAIIGSYAAIKAVPNFSLRGTNILTVGIIASFLNLTKAFIRPFAETSSQMNIIMQAFSGAKRIFDFIDTKYESDEGKIVLNKKDVKGLIEFKNVCFEYEEGKPILKNITFYAKPGQKIALVGHTGAGKTTVTNLINRFYDIQSGQILYEGVDIKEYTKESLRNSLAVVLQDVNLFTGTIIDNIRYGNLNASDEECIRAAHLANANLFIDMLPQGYNTMISAGGTSLSQGQRQLISIARALVNDPRVLILDEATSSIDTRTEKLISQGMDKLMEGRTVIVIAHRLSTIRNANHIMVLEKGEIIESGDHDYLMGLKGEYYDLYTGAVNLE